MRGEEDLKGKVSSEEGEVSSAAAPLKGRTARETWKSNTTEAWKKRKTYSPLKGKKRRKR